MASRQVSKEINGRRTDVLLQPFADRYLILVTQLGKVGSLIQASIPATTPLAIPKADAENLPLPEPSPAIQLTTLLGSTSSEHLHTLHSLYATQIATIIWTEEAAQGSDSRRSVVIGIALSKMEGFEPNEMAQQGKELFQGVMTMIYDLLRST